MHFHSCRFAPLVLLLCLSGCFDSYGRDGRLDAGGLSDYACDCCGVTVHVADSDDCFFGVCDPYCFAPSDAGPDASLARPDAPLDPSCGPRPVDVVCFDHVPAGTPTSVSVALGLEPAECFCDQEIVCSAEITGPFTLALTTSLCPESPICRACTAAPVGSCALPALDAGRWLVTVNGRSALDLDVTPPDVLPEHADVCVRRAASDGCGSWPAAGFDVGRACHASTVPEGTRAHIRVYDACGGCMERGPCEVTVLDGVIAVRATRSASTCEIACDPVCVSDEHICLTPPLEAGSYRVLVDGLAVDEATTLEVGGEVGPETCAGG